jgi:hypothetical protein
MTTEKEENKDERRKIVGKAECVKSTVNQMLALHPIIK